jgi:aminobenzoyl-glutamate utilization protein B
VQGLLQRGVAALADFLVPLDANRNPAIGSTDVGDVSWVVPTVQATGSPMVR